MRFLKRIQLETEEDLVRGLTNLPKGPHAASLLRLFDAGADDIQYVVSPSGDSFGIEVGGSGLKFVASAAHELAALTAPSVGERMIAAMSGLEQPRAHFELTLGGSPRLLCGFVVEGADQARRALAADGVPTAEIKRVLPDGAEPRALNLLATPTGKTHWVVWGRLAEASFALGTAAEIGSEGVFTGLITGRPDLTWLRRDSMPDLQLVDWLFARGFRGDYATRLGRVHAQLECEGPVRMRFEVDEISETLTLHYRTKLSW